MSDRWNWDWDFGEFGDPGDFPITPPAKPAEKQTEPPAEKAKAADKSKVRISVAWIHTLAKAVNPVDAPSEKSIFNKCPAAERTGTTLAAVYETMNLPTKFPKIPWPENYADAVFQVSNWENGS